jgi:O-acetylhomoserine/O-acetylserine sulfhydrylase-like pyridoxal-dependent enzyme
MGAERALVVTSGMEALDVITRLVRAGEEIIAEDDLYGGTNRLLSFLAKSQNVKTHHIDNQNRFNFTVFIRQDTFGFIRITYQPTHQNH